MGSNVWEKCGKSAGDAGLGQRKLNYFHDADHRARCFKFYVRILRGKVSKSIWGVAAVKIGLWYCFILKTSLVQRIWLWPRGKISLCADVRYHEYTFRVWS